MAKLLPVILVAVCLIGLGDALVPQVKNKFYYDLYTNSVAEKGGNVLVSPYSVTIALSLLYMGAGGQTAVEISNKIGLDNTEPTALAAIVAPISKIYEAPNSPITLANKIYTRNDYLVLADIAEYAYESFGSEISRVKLSDVKSAEMINNWVAQKTNNKIKNVISSESLTSHTKMVMINAVYFNGTWKTSFEKDRTQKHNFWTSETEKTEVDMMYVKGTFKYAKLPELNAVAVELPYANSNLSMLVILPNEKTGLPQLEEKMASYSVVEISEKLRDTPVSIYMPKFQTEYEISLIKPLEKLGLKQIFSRVDADFIELWEKDGPGPVFVNEFAFKALIEVDEEGAEDADSTAHTQQSDEILIDRPFMYIIHADSYSYFWGSQRNF